MSSKGPPAGADLRKAAGSGDTARVTALLGRGVAVDSRSEDGWTPLMCAANGGRTATVEALLSRKAGVDLQNNNGATPLMWAARQGHTATVEALLSHKAGVDLQDKNGSTALYCAAYNGHTAIVEVLIAAGAGMNIKTKSGSTPLTVAAEFGHTAVVQSLVSAGVDMDTQTNNGQTALYFAAWKRHTAVVEVLVAGRANVNIVNNIGRTPLMVAAECGHTATLQSLVAHGVDMDTQDKDGSTALILALYKKEFEAAEVLIKAGAGLNQQDEDNGATALFYAAKEGHLPSVRLLLEGGADPTHKDKDGDTPFDVAKQNGHDSIMEELKKHTASQPVVIPFSDLDFKETVGKGTFGVVRKGYWTSSDGGRQLVAIKQVDAVDEKEIKILGSLHHANIIKLYGSSKNELNTFLVTDFAEKGSLYDFISERLNSPDLKRALPWAKQVAEGMLYLHRRGIVHRDLKSSNVVLTSEWVAKICDLGAARELDHTTMMTSIGTVAWMAPEMLKEERASPKCDVYSYAIVLWELVSFQVPFEGLARFPIMLKVTNGERPAIPSGCDQSLSDLIQRCWAQEFKERPPFAEIVRTLMINSFT